MAKRFLAAVLLAVLVSAGRAPAADFASAVPEDAVFFAEVTDPMGVWADFEKSGLRDIVRSVPQSEMGFRMMTGMVQQVALQRLGIRWSDFITSYASRFAVVLVDPPAGEDTLPCLLLDASANKEALTKLLGGVEATVRANDGTAQFADEVYRDISVRIMPVGRLRVAYAFVGEVLAVSSVGGMKRLLDGRARRPLATNPAFARVRQALAVPKGVAGFANASRLLQGLGPAPGAEMKQIYDLGLAGLQWVGFSAAFDGAGLRERFYLSTGDHKVGLVKLLSSLTPGSTKAAEVLPATCPILLSLTFKDGPELWKALLDFLAEGGEAQKLARIDEGRRQVQSSLGINFDEDFVGALGGEVFLAGDPDYAATIAENPGATGWASMLPIVGLRVAKPEALKVALHRFIMSQPILGQGVERKVETCRDVEVNTLVLPGREDRPAYALVGDYLLVSLQGAGTLRKCIEAHGTGETLAKVPRFAGFHNKMPASYLGMAFTDLQGLALAFSKADAARRPGNAPNPMTPLLEQLRGVYATLVPQPDGLMVETYSRVGLLGLAVGGFVGYRRAAPGPPGLVEPGNPADF